MKAVMITSDRSGSGKTLMTMGLLRCLQNRGFDMGACKCGPDYIDPMFHESVLKIPSRNLDTFLMGEAKTVREISKFADKDAVIAEGAMGYYDGLGNTDRHSAYHIARITGMPAVAVISPGGAALTIAAQLRGMLDFREDSNIKGIIFNNCSEKRYENLKEMTERETGIRALGYLPHIKEAEIESRHLGLKTPEEIKGLEEKVDIISNELEKRVDIDLFLQMMKSISAVRISSERNVKRCRLAVAKDEAFCFYYKSSLEALEEAGAELVFFSPLHNSSLPLDIDGLYLGGGYPELYAEELSENKTMLNNIRYEIENGLPTIAECGGFLYLGKSITDDMDRKFEMAGVLGGNAERKNGLVRFGYENLEIERNSMLFNAGESIPVHEFHHWDTDENGMDTEVKKAGNNISYRGGFVKNDLYAAFPHLSLEGVLPLAKRFVDKMCINKTEKSKCP